MSYKRKRITTEDYGIGRRGSQVYRPYKKPMKARRRFVAGQDRVGGYYGRFSGSKGELKFFDVDLDDAVIAGGGTVTDSINKIAQGVTESQRVGRKCTIKSIWWRYRITLPEQDAVADPAPGDNIRVILYMDKQCNGATAAVTDLLEGTDFNDFRNLANQNRFVFVMDTIHEINYAGMASDGAGLVSQGGKTVAYIKYKKCNTPIEFSSTTGAIGEIRSNNFGVLLISSGGTAGFASKIRVRFSDA